MASQAMRGWALRGRNGPWAGQLFPLAGVVCIGRSASAEIALPETFLSRRHALVTAAPEGVTIQDLGSSGGTRVNNMLVRGEVALREGDVIQIGWFEFELCATG